MCDSDCVPALSYEEEASARAILENRVEGLRSLAKLSHDSTEVELRERLAYIVDLLDALVDNPLRFDAKLEKWTAMINNRSIHTK